MSTSLPTQASLPHSNSLNPPPPMPWGSVDLGTQVYTLESVNSSPPRFLHILLFNRHYWLGSNRFHNSTPSSEKAESSRMGSRLPCPFPLHFPSQLFTPTLRSWPIGSGPQSSQEAVFFASGSSQISAHTFLR